MADSKNWDFQLPQFSIFLGDNYRDWSLGWYDKLIQRALMWLNLFVFIVKNALLVFLALFWGTSDSLITTKVEPHWYLTFASIYHTIQMNNPLNFYEKKLRIGGAENLGF